MDKAALQADLDRIDATIGKPLQIVYLIFFTIGISSLLWSMFWNMDAAIIVVMFYGFAMLVQFFYVFIVKRCKEVILGAYGYRCQSCHKTPTPRYFDATQKNNFCPHCQLKYWPDSEGIA